MELIRLLFGFNGRIDRGTFFLATTCQGAVLLALGIMFSAMPQLAHVEEIQSVTPAAMEQFSGIREALSTTMIIWGLAQLPLVVKRTRDMNRTLGFAWGYFIFTVLSLVPVISTLGHLVTSVMWGSLSWRASRPDAPDLALQNKTPADLPENLDTVDDGLNYSDEELLKRAAQLREVVEKAREPALQAATHQPHSRPKFGQRRAGSSRG